MLAPGKIRIVDWEEEQYQYPLDRPEATRVRNKRSREKKRAERNAQKAESSAQNQVVSPSQNAAKTPDPAKNTASVIRDDTSRYEHVTSLERALQQDFQRPATGVIRVDTSCYETDKDTDKERDQDQEEYIQVNGPSDLVVTRSLDDETKGGTRSRMM